MHERRYTRREFVGTTSSAVAGSLILPRHVLGAYGGRRAPSDTPNVAVVGMGQQGTENMEELIDHANLVAVADVDFGFVERTVLAKRANNQGEPREKGLKLNEQFAKAERFNDFRQMLDRRRDIDAVIVATPDHLHAPVAKAAMELGRHVYVQKPLTYSVHEARVLADLARSTGVVTQMGNQGHSHDDARRINEWIEAGIIGDVAEVHVWTNRPIWPQGLARPALPQDGNAPTGWNRTAIANRTAAALAGTGSYAPPAGMDWQLYLGPVPEDLPYHPVYHPFNWRGWVPFGVGALGDMGAHLIDHPFWALRLGYPTWIEATSTPWGGPRANPTSYPLAMVAHYQFPARGALPPVKLHWYDGGLMPRRPQLMPDNAQLTAEGGVIYVGERGVLMHETYGRNPQLWPESLRERAEAVPETYPRIAGGHLQNWVRAIRGEEAATSPFEYAAPLTETMLLGIVALRAGQGRRIHYDGASMNIINVPDANQYLTREYRDGWAV